MTILDLPNARDLGGIRCAGGTVRPGVLFRSAAPTDPSTTASIEALGIQHVVDLRAALEREHQPTDLPPRVRGHVADMLADASYAGAANLGQLAAEALASHQLADEFASRDFRPVMLGSYRDFALLSSARRSTADVIRLLAEPDTGPVLIHCTAGKDRTGWLIAVILRAIGTDWPQITSDYLASGPAVREMFSAFLGVLPEQETAAHVLAPVLGVFPEYLDASRASVDAEFGSFEEYLETGLGIDAATVDRLKARLVQPRSASALM